MRRRADNTIGGICIRLGLKETGFTRKLAHDDKIAPTLLASGDTFRFVDGKYLSHGDMVNISTFPQDYNFEGRDPQFMCGMSVPPVMMANIASEIAAQFFGVQNG